MTAGVLPSRSPNTVTSTAMYVYGVAERGRTLRGIGVVDAAVTVVEHGSLAAIVSPVPSLHLRAKRRDILAHQDVLQRAFAKGTVIPFRFGMVFGGEDAVVSELLEPRHDDLTGLLERLDGLVELSVRAYYVEDAVLREIIRDDSRVARLKGGASDVALGEAVANSLAAKRAAEAAEIEKALVPIAEDAVIEAPRTEYELFRGAFLVRREVVDDFDAHMNSLAGERDGTVIFKYVGPLPPHSFVGAGGS
jgi:gas vesicle protein GvpL/GvpF